MLTAGDRVMRVKSEPNKQMSIATYACGSAVHPIPLVRCSLNDMFVYDLLLLVLTLLIFLPAGQE
jgi:hypothetical protein